MSDGRKKRSPGRGGPTGRGTGRRPRPHHARAEAPDETPFNPRVHDRLASVLDRIGVPAKTDFVPDPFQIESIELIQQGDVVVSAPTGSGKTYIAVRAMEEILAGGGRAWYASPLKALSNSKFLEFGHHFGTERVGLLTGDHKVNPDAPLVVGTTEILRNQLYDAMNRGGDLNVDLVIMDEAHYLGDPDRGVVWEEIIIYLSSRIHLLLLSATIANAEEIADWLTFIRGRKASAVMTGERPVPLFPVFLFPDGELTPLSRGKGLFPKVRHHVEHQSRNRRHRGRTRPPFSRILRILGENDLLPAIFFLPSRADCDQALSGCFGVRDFQYPDILAARAAKLDEILEKYPFLAGHRHIKFIRDLGVAAHHAGHMPHWKLLVEQLMQEGLLTAIFSTSTVAAGVNFPARTVVILQSDRFDGREFKDLTATELLQMTGRAGRRGMDRIGFALVFPGPFLNVELIQSLFHAPPDPVNSQLHINFSMVLNLLLSHEPEQIRNMLDLSLAAFQQDRSQRAVKISGLLDRLRVLIEPGACRDAEDALYYFQTLLRLRREIDRLEWSRPRLERDAVLRQGLTPGRLFEDQGGRLFCVLELGDRHGRPGVMAAKVTYDLGLKKGRVRQKWMPLDRVDRLLDTVVLLEKDIHPRDTVRLIRAEAVIIHHDIDPGRILTDQTDARFANLDARLETLKRELERLPCRECPVAEDCIRGEQSEASVVLSKLDDLEETARASGRFLWSSFLRHFEFLKTEGFVDDRNELTDDGLWAAYLRLDHPLLFAAGIRMDAWPLNDPSLLAAVVAPFVVDRDIAAESRPAGVPPELTSAWFRITTAIEPLQRRLASQGFPVPELKIQPALAIYAWARRHDWDESVDLYGQDPGDMAMLVFRTADNLRQMTALSSAHPELAQKARRAVDLIMKEPVITPL